MLPYDPVQKKRVDHAGGKRASADISDTTGKETNISSFGAKKGTGSTGVPLRYHTKTEYDLLNKDQKDELREWRKGAEFKGNNGKKGKSRPNKKPHAMNKVIAAAVEKKVAEKMKAMEQDKANGNEAEAYIMSIFQKYSAGKTGKAQISEATAEPTPSPSAPSLKSIIRRAKNPSKK